MSKAGTFHVVSSDDGLAVLFHQETQSIFRVSEHFACSFQAAIARRTGEQQMAEHTPELTMAEDLLLQLEADQCYEVLDNPTAIHDAVCLPDHLEQLVLNVAGDCNLRCVYCYVKHSWYQPRSPQRMRPKTAIAAIDTCLLMTDTIKEIKFFGGEPLLNIETIETVCRYCLEQVSGGALRSPPSFLVLTNGTILSEKIIQMIKEYNIQVGISLDGPAEVHDALRFGIDGSGSYKRIAQNIRRLQTEGVPIVTVNGVYGKRHLELGISVIDLMKFYYQEFGLTFSFIVPVAASRTDELSVWREENRECLCQYFAESVKYSLRSVVESKVPLFNLTALTLCALLASKSRRSNFKCGAGTQFFAVSAKGDVFPCALLINYPQYRLGEAECFVRIPIIELNPPLRQTSALPRCEECYAYGLCSVCVAQNLITTGNAYNFEPMLCELQRAQLDAVLLELARIYASPHNWKKFCQVVGPYLPRRCEGV